MAGKFLTEKEVLDRLGITPKELKDLIKQGELIPEEQKRGEGGERLYQLEQVETLEDQSGMFGDESDVLFDLDGDTLQEEPVSEEAGEATSEKDREELPFGDSDSFSLEDDEDAPEAESAAAEPGDEKDEETGSSGLEEFDFLLEDEEDAEPVSEESEPDEDSDSEPESDFPLDEEADDTGKDTDDIFEDSDMITEVVDVSELESGDDDLLSDVIEYSEEDASEEPGIESDKRGAGVPSSQLPTSDITDLDDDSGLFDSAEATSDITKFVEEDDAEEDEQKSKQSEAGPDTDFAEEDLAEYGEAIAIPEPAFPVWVVALLAVVVIFQLLGLVYITENTVESAGPSAISEALNIVRIFR